MRVNTAKMANYLEEKLTPLYYEGKEFGDSFYRYSKAGYWREYPETALRQLVRKEMGDIAKAATIDDVCKLLAYQTYLHPDSVQGDPMLLNVLNGMLDVRTHELVPHHPKFYSKVQLQVRYSKDADYLPWEKALCEIHSDEIEKVNVLQQFFGYCLYPRILFPAALFQIGSGGNGKGVVEHILCKMLGKENISHISMARMEKDFGPVEIRDKLLNSCGETETGMLDVTNFKKIAAGDEIQAEVKYKRDVKFVPIAKHMISMNAFPGVKEKTRSFYRRIIVLEYLQSFVGDGDDVDLKEKLEECLDGVFRWALEGLEYVLEAKKIDIPECCQQAKQRFREKANPLLLFVEEACLLSDLAKSLPKQLYAHYRKWCDESGQKGLGKSNFYEQLRLNFSQVVKKRDDTREYFFGIGVLDDNE